MDRIFLIDGHAQIFRMYYAFMRHPLINSKGIDTSILYGFTKMVLELINREHPTHLAVAFDLHGETFRHKIYKEYKANRTAAPELVVDALEPLKEILRALNIPAIGMEGYEADDVIGSMAKQWANDASKVYMVTPDKDYGQLIDSNIFQYKFPKGSSTDIEIVDKPKLCSQYGIEDPKSVIDILTVWGDASDNIPGVRGIGEVGAKKLIGTYGSIDNLMQHIEELPPKQQEKLREASSHLELSRFLVTIKTDIELPVSLSDIRLRGADKNAVDEIFSRFEFTSLKKMIPAFEEGLLAADDDFPADDPEEGNYFNSYTPETQSVVEGVAVPQVTMGSLDDVRQAAALTKEISLSMTGSGKLILAAADSASTRQKPSGVAFCGHLDSRTAELLADTTIAKTGFSLKETLRKVAGSCQELRLSGSALVDSFAKSDLWDIQLLHYLIDPEVSHNSDFILRQQFGISVSNLQNAEENSAKEMDLFSQIQEDNPAEEESLAKECILYIYLKDKLAEGNIGKLYREVEMPLIGTLAKMELTGVKIDTLQLKDLSKNLTQQMNQIEAKAKDLAGDSLINLSSPKQVGELLFEKLKVSTDVKKTAKGSYPTDEQTLRSISGSHPIIGDILEYRNLKKLLSTYIDALPCMIDPYDGKIHTTFNQALTATGRLSSNNPNLQNIPIRTERGREIRKAFVPSSADGFIVSADYSQIELRLMAHFSGDAHLLDAFNSGMDVHKATAARLFGVEPNGVTDEMRRKAKTVNFGIIYGISSFGLAERMDIGVREARSFIENYFTMYPGVALYIEETVEKARRSGYVETLYGRRRYLKDINSRNANVRKFNERNAVNAPLQGSAADIIKIAMAKVQQRLEKERLGSRMILQVHDELVFDAAACEKDIVMQIAKEEMESVARLNVELIAECGYGKNWLQAH